jgi:alanyl-tRNA synthetase
VVGSAANAFLTEVKEKLHKQIVQLTEACAAIALKLESTFTAPEWNENSSVSVLNDTIAELQASQKELHKKLESQEAQLVNSLVDQYASQFQDKNGIAFLGTRVNLNSADNLKKLAQLLSATQTKAVIVLVNEIEGKASVALSISESLVTEKGWQAPQIIKDKIAPFIKGGGGGQKTLASAGGQDATQLNQVIEAVAGLL